MCGWSQLHFLYSLKPSTRYASSSTNHTPKFNLFLSFPLGSSFLPAVTLTPLLHHHPQPHLKRNSFKVFLYIVHKLKLLLVLFPLDLDHTLPVDQFRALLRLLLAQPGPQLVGGFPEFGNDVIQFSLHSWCDQAHLGFDLVELYFLLVYSCLYL